MAFGSPSRREVGAPLGLIPFVVPDWPDPLSHAEVVDCLRRHAPVAWEVAIPSPGWSTRTSQVIANALEESTASLDRALTIAAGLRPNIAVLYQGLATQLGRECVLDRLRGKIDHVMLEWDATDRAAWLEATAARGMGIVHTLDAEALASQDAGALVGTLAPRSVLYVCWAPVTGGETYSFEVLREAVRRAKRQRPDLWVMTGFGVRDSDQVRRLAAIDGLDAVAIGTALLDCTAQGTATVDAFFGAMTSAAIPARPRTVAEVHDP